MLRELRTFIAVARYGTFSGAGAHIGLTQSAVSAQMQRLEAHLGVALFDRTGRSATLNKAGRRTLELADELIALYARLASPEDEHGRGGSLSVGAIASAHAALLPDAIGAFRRALPAWRIRLVPGVSLNLLAGVDAGEIDMAVIIRPPFSMPAELRWRTLSAEPFVLLAPASKKGADWRELIESEPFIRYDRRSFGGRQVDAFLARRRIAVRDSIEVDELPGIAQLVARGLGVALVPVSDGIGPWPRGAVALDLGDDTFHREIGLVERVRRVKNDEPDAAARLAGCIVAAAERGAPGPAVKRARGGGAA
ncbi:LysR family transcriptional regulator [Caballeronia fortuita]|uniref:LysR family transcriptional regulator n=1 Tax=Caballeronia fortuita TaxID=1777138 RepID=A0A158BIZ9_9BURK|nr:LysR family transcriptional regulator [Caballeronia fortuita]SAK70038.1 LysR family transcriptional regulator [Caballeronia fortuita]